MRILVIGAGATLAEAQHLGIPESLHPPLLSNFARKMFEDFNPHPYLDRYLESLGHVVDGHDGREKFYELEESNPGIINIERFFEFCWVNREKSWDWSPIIEVREGSGLQVFSEVVPGLFRGIRVLHGGPTSVTTVLSDDLDFWDNLLVNGIGRSMASIVIECFGSQGEPGAFRQLDLSKKVAEVLSTNDLVVNLNYDPIFEIAIEQIGERCNYVARSASPSDAIRVAKPHGALNLLVRSRTNQFRFAQPTAVGFPDPDTETRSCIGILPPRFNKAYGQHPVAATIFSTLRDRRPRIVTFWGVGLTDSDTDLLTLYRTWASRAVSVEFINPDEGVVKRAAELLGCEVDHFRDAVEWIVNQH